MKHPFSSWRKASLSFVPAEYRNELERQRQRDLSARQTPALLIYPLIWLIVMGAMLLRAFDTTKFIWSAAIFLALLVVSLLRSILLQLHRRHNRNSQQISYTYLDTGVALTAFSWSVIMSLTLLPTPLSLHYPLVLTATMGFSAGAIVTLSIRRKTVELFLLGMYLLPIVVSISGYSSQPAGLSGLMLVFALAMSAITRLPRGEYERAVVSNLQLRDHALRLTEMSYQDPLTGLRNRRYFDQLLTQELNRANRMGYAFTLLMIDIDHFKRINDRHGHQTGDHCLQHVAQTLVHGLQRAGDMVARIGGEEFAVIMPGVDREEGQRMAEKLLLWVSQSPYESADTRIELTISIGGASLSPQRLLEAEVLVQMADQALYQSKHDGRNRVTWAQVEDV